LIQDFGGIPVAGGGRTRSGLLYRSGDLYRISKRDLARVEALHLQQVIDLRQQEVSVTRPNLYQAPLRTGLPVRLGEFEKLTLQAALRREVDWSRYDIHGLYILILEKNKDYFRKFFEILVEGPHPILLHCTAGKDRTGVFGVALLLALQVTREQAWRWYFSINQHLENNTPAWVKLLARFSKVPRESLMLNGPALEKLFSHIDEQYGGIEGYLDLIGFAGLGQLRAIFTG
jgi:protein-tyrosine phosphatase